MAFVGTDNRDFKLALAELNKFGLLLESDAFLPNVCTVIAGERMHSSWWSHPLSHRIFAVNELLADHQDVMLTKLISGKVTLVHRKLWRHIYAIGTSHEEWQTKSLSAPARLLLKKLAQSDTLTTNKLGPSFGKKPGDTARELEQRLLIHAEPFHTASGSHAKLLETWRAWAKRIGFRVLPMKPDPAKRKIEQSLALLNEEFDGDGRLPWQKKAMRIR